MNKEEEKFVNVGKSIEGAIQSQMFGKPCFKIGNKAFCCFFQNAMVFKLSGGIHSEALSADDAQLFDPSGKGRPMKEWVQLPFDYADHWHKYAVSAMGYVSGQ